MVSSIIEKGTSLNNTEQLATLFELVAPLVKDIPDCPSADMMDADDFSEEQCLMSQFIVLLKGSSLDMHYQMLQAARKQFGAGGEKRYKRTFPALVFQALQLALSYEGLEEPDPMLDKKLPKVFAYCHGIISALAQANLVDLALRLFLQAALTVNRTNFEKAENVAYEFMSQAFLLYEEEVSDSKAQIAAITLIVGTLEQMSCLSEESYTPLASKCALVSSKLMKKPDQARGVCISSQVFWSGKTSDTEGELRDGKQVLKCLQKALKVANSCVEPLVQCTLFVEIFNNFLVYYERSCEEVSIMHLNKIVGLINRSLECLEGEDSVDSIKQHFKNTIDHINTAKSCSAVGRSYEEFEAESIADS